MTKDDAAVIEAMRRFGGSFMQQFARLYLTADLVNRDRLRDAFQDYWASYRQMQPRVPPDAEPVPAHVKTTKGGLTDEELAK